MNFVEDFRASMAGHGLSWRGDIVADGKLHRFKTEGDDAANSWYCLYSPDPIAAGAYGCWKRSFTEKWSQKNGERPSRQELQVLQKRWREADDQRTKDEQSRQLRMAEKAKAFLTPLSPAGNHLYLETKEVPALGDVRIDPDGNLILPLTDGKTTWSYQSIDALGDKLFMPGGRVQGCYYVVSDRADGPLVICEGYATGCSIHLATSWATVCAMNCGNLLPVAQALRKDHPGRMVVIAADNDRNTEGNPGVTKATEAAKVVKAELVVPDFPESDSRSSDFNDLYSTQGLIAVKKAFDAVCGFKLSFMSYDELRSIELPKEHVLLGDHVLSIGSLASILAPGGVGKSSFIQQMAAACTAGHKKFLAWDIQPAVQSMRWLIVQAENSPYRLVREADTLRRWLGPEGWLRFNQMVRVLVPLTEPDSFLDLDHPEVPIKLQQAIELFSPNIVVFDALYNFSLRELSKGAEMLAAVSNCTRLSKWRNSNRTPIILHHALAGTGGSSKALGFERASYGRDSKILHQLSRSVINLVAVSEDDNSQILVSCGKCSDGREFSPFVIRKNPESLIFEIDDQTNVQEVVQRVKQPNKRGPIMTSERVRELIDISGATKSELITLLREDCGCTRESSYRYIKDAELKKAINYSTTNQKYFRG